MKSTFIYPEFIEKLYSVCAMHLSGESSAEDLQKTIQLGEAIIVAVEEKELREFLTVAEGRLDEAKFAYDIEQQPDVTKKIAGDIIARLDSWGDL